MVKETIIDRMGKIEIEMATMKVEVNNLSEKFDKLDSKFDDLSEKVEDLLTILTGDGKQNVGIISKINSVDDRVKIVEEDKSKTGRSRQWIVWLILTIISVGAAIFGLFL